MYRIYMYKSKLHNYYSVLRLEGADANSFLQGQFTNDVRGSAPLGKYGMWLNHKGKAQGDSHVLKLADGRYLLVSDFTSAQWLKAHLESFIIADDVAVTDETDAWCGLAIWGGDLAAGLSAAGVAPPGASGLAALQEGWIFSSRRSGCGSVDVLARPAQVAEWAKRLARAGSIPADGNAMAAERIRSAIPAVPADIGPGDLPAEGGLDAVAISFTKGCFLGQEVVARLKNLGQVRRRLVPVRRTGDLRSGQTLYQGEKKVGEIRSTATVADGAVAMAMLSLPAWDRAIGFSLDPGGVPDVSPL